jgi:hypothetical protein
LNVSMAGSFSTSVRRRRLDELICSRHAGALSAQSDVSREPRGGDSIFPISVSIE